MEQFGVSEEQVRRDHAISVVLAALSDSLREDLLFFGGTALSRTYLEAERLSEDIDLIALGKRTDVASRLVRTVERAVQRSHGRVT
jgi:predicted nucleotidyltransferase component of viral defense system